MHKKSLLKSASIISGATLLSRILGFIRDVLIARVFGTEWFAQAFLVAFRIPNMLRDLVAEGASNAALVPVFSEYLAIKQRKEFWKLVNTVLIAFVLVVLIITLIGVFLSPLIVRLIAPGFSQSIDKLNLTIAINRPLFVYLLLVSISAFVMAILYSFKSFLSPSLSPCIFNIVVILGVLLADNSVSGIWKLVYAVIIGGVTQILIQLPALFKLGFKLRPFEYEKRIFQHPGTKKVVRLLLPRILGTGVYELNILIDTVFASFSFLAGQGAIAAIYYSTRIVQFPLGIFGHSIANSAFPTLSELAAKKEMQKFAEIVEFSLTNILFITIPAGFGLIVLSHPIIKLVFERGEFTAYSTMITATALAFFSIGLAGYAANRILALSFNSLHDTMTPVKTATLALILNIIFNALFTIVFHMKVAGLAFASSISAIIGSIVLYKLLHKRIPDMNSKNIKDQIIKMTLASMLMAIATYITWSILINLTHPIVCLLIAIIISILIYISASIVLGVYQANRVFKWILERK